MSPRFLAFWVALSALAAVVPAAPVSRPPPPKSRPPPPPPPVAFPTFPSASAVNLSALPHFSGKLPPSVHANGGQLAVNTARDSLYHLLVLSERDPAGDPLTLWFNGGPGSSSIQYGFLSENGVVSYFSSPAPSVQVNPTRWSLVSNVVWCEIVGDGARSVVLSAHASRALRRQRIDQPLGTGFSHLSNASANASAFVTTRPQMQADFLAFMTARPPLTHAGGCADRLTD